MKKVSLEDISKELGVSKTLVSFVMNGRAKEQRISDEMAEKVLKKAKEMGYEANYAAKVLRTGKSDTIGLIIADISNTFFAKLARSIENNAQKHKYNVIYGSTDEDTRNSVKLIEVLKKKNVDGLIISPSIGDQKIIKQLNKEKIPYVLVDRYFPEIQSDVVVVNNFQGSYDIINRAIEQGSKKIAFLNFNAELVNMQDRFKGYQQALKDAGIPYEEKLVKNLNFSNMDKEIETAMKELLSISPTIDTIYFSNNQLMLLGVKYLLRTDKEFLSKVKVTSFDCYEFMDLLDLPISYGEQPIKEIGKVAVDLIVDKIENKHTTPKIITLPIKN
ncbi:transcriptional regulator, LacI family [Zhouia amylolytica]|uniref:Transcriptional regulator, LacI family n=1 Tax=Zhouia amylolytica TaxID=376730 RepID=A0A1I6T856_9FLAO|nr:LacI family DNA-binding transcriptional regulator [Zhouia amylolytica]SFS85127.1 transcriptional regulator, LacI family [Zhouia amylolytica]